jgi:4-amino-4-deoxy-L-arabinose transferase-like glycosyltransferase
MKKPPFGGRKDSGNKPLRVHVFISWFCSYRPLICLKTSGKAARQSNLTKLCLPQPPFLCSHMNTAGFLTCTKRAWHFFLASGVLLFLYTYLSHLGTLPLEIRTDEGRRALVTAEMMISGDYVSPTLNGEPFLNKPPLYNWIMAASFKLGGNYHPFWMRLPVILFTALFGFAIFRFVGKELGRFAGYVVAFAFITNGRILIYDSLQSFIDIAFGFAMYLLMMLVYHYGRQKKYWQLFIYTYLLTVVGYMMKGLPALAFQAITLLTYFLYTRRFKVLLGLQHMVGIAIFFVCTAGYYTLYFTANHITPAVLFTRLLTESTDRTVVKFGFWETVLHFLYYPLEMMYHYAPWLLLMVVLVRRDFFRIVNAHPFVQFNWWVFFANFVIYWTSPQVYARYLFALLPMLFTVVFYVFYTCLPPRNNLRRVLESVLGGVLALCATAMLVLPFVEAASGKVHLAAAKAFTCAALLGAQAYTYFKQPSYRLPLLVIGLFVIRLGFNWFVIDQRGDYLRQAEKDAATIVNLSQGRPLYLLRGANVGNFDGMSFHIATRRNEILAYDSSFSPKAYYICDSASLSGKTFATLHSFENHLAPRLHLVKFSQ